MLLVFLASDDRLDLVQLSLLLRLLARQLVGRGLQSIGVVTLRDSRSLLRGRGALPLKYNQSCREVFPEENIPVVRWKKPSR